MTLVVGAGCSRGCPDEELVDLVERALADAGGGPVVAVATVDRRAGEPCMLAVAARHGVELRTHDAAALAAVLVPSPSEVVERHVGTPSVAEAAALLTAGPGAELVMAKRRSAHATCAIARVSA